VIHSSRFEEEHKDKKTCIKKFSDIDGLSGKLSKTFDKKLMNSVLGNDKKTIEDGKLIRDSINRGISFNPSLIFEQIVKNYSMAKKIYGESIIKNITDYNPDYIKKNIKIPEFQRELKEKIIKNVERLNEKELIDNNGCLEEKGLELASLILYTEELDNLVPKGILGKKIHKKSFIYGDKQDIKHYKKQDRYRDIAIEKSVKLAIRRGHKKLCKADLKTFQRKSKGQICIVYGLDASGSMKGIKLDKCKKAGIALAYKAIEEKDKVGLIVFGSEIKEEIAPTEDFTKLLKSITSIKASKETDIALTIKKSIELFPNKEITKHLILLTDALPTKGEEPEKETLEAVSVAKSNGITISLVGIKLDKNGKQLAEKITELGEGKLYAVKDTEDIDKIVVEDYYYAA